MQFFIFFIIFIFGIANAAFANDNIIDEAEKIYQKYSSAIYQIQVIDKVSNKKTAIGSGFQISNEGHIATNYHVVSELIQNPKSNRLEYLTDDDKRGKLNIVYADIVHDLAIVQKIKNDKSKNNLWLKLGNSNLSKGTKIFSLGNPHDIGFTIIEGIYNGISKNSLYEKIHFSGSLNPGMSGGPALNHKGEVIGINVSTAGNQISFLVPVEHLKKLFEKAKKSNNTYPKQANEIIKEQLFTNQDRFLTKIITGKWKTTNFGSMNLPAEISDIFKCWGRAKRQEQELYKHYFMSCSSEDNIYIKDNFTTGIIRYDYHYLEAKKALNLPRFYSIYEAVYNHPDEDFFQNAKESDVSNFACNDKFVTIAHKKWKTSFCIREYKKYRNIYDLNLYAFLLADDRRGLVIFLTAQGIGKDNIIKLTDKFLKQISQVTNIR